MSSFRQQPVPLDAGHRFELAGLAGPNTIGVSPLPPRWVVKSIRYRGVDITSVATEFRTGSDEIEVLLTGRIALVRGRVLGAGGDPVVRAACTE